MPRQRSSKPKAIEFYCLHCGNEMTVDGTKAGTKGRCPKCRMVFTIPNHSSNIPEEFDPDTVFHHKRMNALYAEFASKHDNIIQAQLPQRMRLQGYDTDVLVLAIQTNRMRKQIVCVACLPTSTEPLSGVTSNYAKVVFVSRVGQISNHELSTAVLRLVEMSSFSAFLNDEMTLQLGCIRKMDTIDYEEFEDIILGLAWVADLLEDKITGDDVN